MRGMQLFPVEFRHHHAHAQQQQLPSICGHGCIQKRKPYTHDRCKRQVHCTGHTLQQHPYHPYRQGTGPIAYHAAGSRYRNENTALTFLIQKRLPLIDGKSGSQKVVGTICKQMIFILTTTCPSVQAGAQSSPKKRSFQSLCSLAPAFAGRQVCG